MTEAEHQGAAVVEVDPAEDLRRSKERHLEAALAYQAQITRMASTLRWLRVMVLAFLATESGTVVLNALAHEGSWAYRVARVMPWLVEWMAVHSLLLLPQMASLLLPKLPERWRWWTRRLAAMAMLGCALGFAAMAYVVQRFDAPQSVLTWSISCGIFLMVLLHMAASVNAEQRDERLE